MSYHGGLAGVLIGAYGMPAAAGSAFEAGDCSPRWRLATLRPAGQFHQPVNYTAPPDRPSRYFPEASGDLPRIRPSLMKRFSRGWSCSRSVAARSASAVRRRIPQFLYFRGGWCVFFIEFSASGCAARIRAGAVFHGPGPVLLHDDFRGRALFSYGTVKNAASQEGGRKSRKR